MTSTEHRIDWQAVAVMISCALAIVAFNAWCMKLVIDNAISKNMISIMEKYATKEELRLHISQMHKP